MTALLLATENGHFDIVKELITAGAEVEVSDEVNTEVIMILTLDSNN